jgi:hypothetical protein
MASAVSLSTPKEALSANGLRSAIGAKIPRVVVWLLLAILIQAGVVLMLIVLPEIAAI